MLKVVIGVSGGVAKIIECPPEVEVEIVDYDNLAAGEPKSPIDEFLRLANIVQVIVDGPGTWQEKYDWIFRPEVSRRIRSLVRLEYYDPDTSYEDDVLAFYIAVRSKVRELTAPPSRADDSGKEYSE